MYRFFPGPKSVDLDSFDTFKAVPSCSQTHIDCFIILVDLMPSKHTRTSSHATLYLQLTNGTRTPKQLRSLVALESLTLFYCPMNYVLIFIDVFIFIAVYF